MSNAATPVPEGFRTVTPHIVVSDVAAALDAYQKSFGAAEIVRMDHNGVVMYAEMKVGDSVVMLAQECAEQGMLGPQEKTPSPVAIHLYVEDADALFDQAVAAGCTAALPMMDAFWGDRYGMVVDPFHHRWSIATRKEALSPEQIGQRAAKEFGQAP